MTSRTTAPTVTDSGSPPATAIACAGKGTPEGRFSSADSCGGGLEDQILEPGVLRAQFG